jgi:hypothetical protein
MWKLLEPRSIAAINCGAVLTVVTGLPSTDSRCHILRNAKPVWYDQEEKNCILAPKPGEPSPFYPVIVCGIYMLGLCGMVNFKNIDN